MISSDFKGILHRVFGCIKREEIGEVVQQWGILSKEQTQEVSDLLASGTRAVPRKTVVQKIVDCCVKDQVHRKHISQLDLLCNIRHPEKKKWAVYELKGAETDEPKKAFDPDSYFNDMTKYLSAYFKHDICMDEREGGIWLRIGVYEGSRHSAASFLNNAVIVVYHPHSNHVIISSMRKGLVDFIMQALTQSLGYTSCKETKLSGRSPTALADLTLNQASQGWFSKFRLNQVDTNPLVKTQTRKRKSSELELEDRSLVSENVENDRRCSRDLDRSFGPNKQPKLERLQYEMETKFRGTRVAPNMATREEPFRSTIRFEGADVLEGLKQLRPCGIASTALPHLLEQVLTSSKNHFRIYDKSHREKQGS